MIDEKPIQGFKKSEYTTPDKLFGTADVQMEDLPNGVRLYLREKAVDLGTKKVSVLVYRLVDDGGNKLKRIFCGRMKINRTPEDDEIAEQFGGGKYIWILKWQAADGKDQGIISEPIDVDDESGRAMHEAWKQRQAPAASTPAAPVAAPAAQAGGVDIAGILAIMAATEEKTIAGMERMAAIFQGQKSEGPAEILKSAYAGASEMMAKAVENTMALTRTVSKAQVKQVERELEPPDDGEEEGDPDGMPGVPAWLAGFWPHIEKGLGTLLKGGPVGSAVKTLILSSDEWQEIFKDKDKWGQAVSAMEQNFGTDRTKRALDILLNRREESAAKSTAKKKGK
ncbi:MAG TPA: hypothetical protein VF077_12785 [Nitrospiraceae bacterium]